MSCPANITSLVSELKELYPGFDVTAHLQEVLRMGLEKRNTIEKFKDSYVEKLYNLLEGKGVYMEITSRLYIEAPLSVDKDAVRDLLLENNYQVDVDIERPDYVSFCIVHTNSAKDLYNDLVSLIKANDGVYPLDTSTSISMK